MTVGLLIIDFLGDGALRAVGLAIDVMARLPKSLTMQGSRSKTLHLNGILHIPKAIQPRKGRPKWTHVRCT
jgi:hypothetical protein